jgi:hypothetical protein
MRRMTGLMIVSAITGCISLRQNPNVADSQQPDILGAWVDVAATTANDSTLRVFLSDRSVRTLHILLERDSVGRILARRRESWAGFWYVTGSVSDAGGRLLCIRSRAREGAICNKYRVDMATADPARRRVTIVENFGNGLSCRRVLLEHLGAGR